MGALIMPEIAGVEIHPLRIIEDERGSVMHMLRADAAHFEKFGEIYFSTIRAGAIKAWKRHRRVTQNLAVPSGSIRLVLYDDREASPSRGSLQELVIGRDRYCLVRIPPLLWYGFQGLAAPESLIANCATLPHDPAETETVDSASPSIPFRW